MEIESGVLVSLFILLICILILMWLNRKRKLSQRYIKRRTYTLQDCKSSEDLKIELDAYRNNLQKELSENKQRLQEARRKGYIRADIAWTERIQELAEVSDTLYKNLEYENSKRLNADRFHRYTDLHFRSIILGNIAYDDYKAAKKVRDEVNEILVAIGKGEIRVRKDEKKELYEIKDTCVNTTKYLYDRMISIQNKTSILREKIGSECGERGKVWYRNNQKSRH